MWQLANDKIKLQKLHFEGMCYLNYIILRKMFTNIWKHIGDDFVFLIFYSVYMNSYRGIFDGVGGQQKSLHLNNSEFECN